MQSKSSVEMIGHNETAIANKAFLSRRIGVAVFGIGAVYIIIAGWLSTWWIVPAMREVGLHSFGSAVMLWAVSAPLGALLVAIGGALMASDRRLWFWVASSIAIVFWLASGPISQILSPLFGIGGGLIMVFFLGFAWNWVNVRPQLSHIARSASDLQMIGMVFFFIAAWNLCGLFGAPVFLLRPELTQKFNVSILGISMASTVMICLTISWGCMFFSQRIVVQENRRSVHK